MDLSALADQETLHLHDTTRTEVRILPEPTDEDLPWARSNPGEWKYFVDPRVDEEKAELHNVIGGWKAADDGQSIETWLNPDLVPTEEWADWELTNEFEVVVWRVTFGFNNIGHFIEAFTRANFIMLLPEDDPLGQRGWPLVPRRSMTKPEDHLTLELFTSAGKLPPDTNPWLRRTVSGHEVLRQVCPIDWSWILINYKAFPYIELSGDNLTRWWRELSAATPRPDIPDPPDPQQYS